MSPRHLVQEPKRDTSRTSAWLLAAWLMSVLVVTAIALDVGSLPLIPLGVAAVPAMGLIVSPAHLPVARYLATTAAAVNGSLLVFLASLTFDAAATRGVPVGEPDAQWLLTVAVAALVAAIGVGLLVHRTQVLEAHQRWEETQVLARLVSAAGVLPGDTGGAGRAQGSPRAIGWVVTGMAVVALARGRRRRRSR